MIDWEPRGTMLAFKALDDLDPDIKRVYALGFRIMDNWQDRWTCRMQNFKKGEASAVKAAARVLPKAIATLGLKEVPTALCPAISSGDAVFRMGSPLDILGQQLAAKFGWRWLPQSLKKKAHRQLHSLGSLAERQEEIRGAYSCTGLPDVERVVILDDLCTNGTTYTEIARAVKVKYSGLRFRGIALGKNERAAFMKSARDIDLTNAHIPDEYAREWDSA